MIGYAVTERFELVFDTLASTRKALNLRRDPRIALVIGGPADSDEQTVQYEGVIDEPHGPELERLKQVYYTAHPDGPDRLNWAGLIYIRVRPTWIRYSDYRVGPPQIVEFGAADLMTGPAF